MIGIMGIVGILSCTNKQNISKFGARNITENIVTKIEVKKVDFDILTIARVGCNDFESWFKDIKTNVIENQDSISILMHIIDNLQVDTTTYNLDKVPDVRAKLLIYHTNNKTDTLCMGRDCIMLNNKLYFFDDKFIKFIEKL